MAGIVKLSIGVNDSYGQLKNALFSPLERSFRGSWDDSSQSVKQLRGKQKPNLH
jgi:hypothetical protein